MATIVSCLQGLCFSSCCQGHEDIDDARSVDPSLDPLLSRSPPLIPANMPPRTYGTKRSAVASGSAAIFGKASSSRAPLEELTSTLDNLSLTKSKDKDENGDDEDETEDGTGDYSADTSSYFIPPSALKPLIDAYQMDLHQRLHLVDWNDVIDDDANLQKIAEASYAEVYRITTSAGSSILKVMRVRVPGDGDSMTSDTAIEVTSLVSEIRIMNALTTVPGFVTFKDSHLVQGMIPRCIKKSWEKYAKEKEEGWESWFRHPKKYDEEAIFLVIELGDAGDVLDECELTTLDQLYDVFIGTTVALARAEVTNEFEHRDLHENNICIKRSPAPPTPKSSSASTTPLKFGFSGWEVTIIDYGLSRALLTTDSSIAFHDLDAELSLFQSQDTGIPGIQYDTYRRMRTYLHTSTRTMKPAAWHSGLHPLPVGRGWNTYIPYTNVLWLRYLWVMLVAKLDRGLWKAKEDKGEVSEEDEREVEGIVEGIEEEGKELRRLFEPRAKVENGAFVSAQGVLGWLLEKGWVREDQILGEGEEGSSFWEA